MNIIEPINWVGCLSAVRFIAGYGMSPENVKIVPAGEIEKFHAENGHFEPDMAYFNGNMEQGSFVKGWYCSHDEAAELGRYELRRISFLGGTTVWMK